MALSVRVCKTLMAWEARSKLALGTDDAAPVAGLEELESQLADLRGGLEESPMELGTPDPDPRSLANWCL